MPDFRLPAPEEGKTDKETLNNLFDTLIKFRKELQFLLSNLDDKNIDSLDASKIKNLEVDAAHINTLIANYIAANVIVSNTVIVQELTAARGNIAELTVDELDTSDKVQNYLNGSTADVNYIKIHDQTIEYITAQTTGSSTVQVKNRYNQNIYWVDSTHAGTTLNNTGLPVFTYVYAEYVKMKMEFYNNGTDYVPRIVLGTGSGVGDIAKGFIEKIDGGMKFRYVKYDGTPVEFVLGENGISLPQISTNGVMINYLDRPFDASDLQGVTALHVRYNPTSVLATGSLSNAYAFTSIEAIEIATNVTPSTDLFHDSCNSLVNWNTDSGEVEVSSGGFMATSYPTNGGVWNYAVISRTFSEDVSIVDGLRIDIVASQGGGPDGNMGGFEVEIYKAGTPNVLAFTISESDGYAGQSVSGASGTCYATGTLGLMNLYVGSGYGDVDVVYTIRYIGGKVYLYRNGVFVGWSTATLAGDITQIKLKLMNYSTSYTPSPAKISDIRIYIDDSEL